MDRLPTLGGEETYSLSSSISKVEGALVAAPELGIKPETVSAFAKIASTVSSWITEAIQVKEVKAMVSNTATRSIRCLPEWRTSSASMLAILEGRGPIASFAEFYEGGLRSPSGPSSLRLPT